MNKKIYLLFILGIILISNVMALGITPGRTTFDFEPGARKEVEFTVINSEGQDTDFVVLIRGELNESLGVSEASFNMAANENEKKLKYILQMPSEISPGPHTAEIVVFQLPKKLPTSDAFVGASVGVATQIYLNVPYPGKYAEADMNVVGADASGKITFVIPIQSRGDLDIVRARANIDIYSPVNEKIATVKTNEISILSGERKEIAAVYDGNLNPGNYRAVATVLYDEQTLDIEKQFSVGERNLELKEVVVNDFTLGGIAKFEMLIENKWSESITGAYAQMLIYNKDGEVMADFKSPTYDISALQKTLMIAFWDTEGVQKGNYDASVFLRYGEKSDQQDLKLTVSDKKIKVAGVGYVISSDESEGGLFGNTLVVVLVIGIVLMILINLTWFLVLRKRLKK